MPSIPTWLTAHLPPILAEKDSTLALADVVEALQSPAARDVLESVENRLAPYPLDPFASLSIEEPHLWQDRFQMKEEKKLLSQGHPPPSPLLPKDFFDRALLQFSAQSIQELPAVRCADAITAVFSDIADSHGEVQTREVRKAFGREGLELFHQIQDLLRVHPKDTPIRWEHALGFFSFRREILRRILASVPRETFVDRMPAFQEVVAQVGPNPFKGFRIAGIQHLLPTSLALFDAMVQGGASPDYQIAGKVYSTNPVVWARLFLEGHVGVEGHLSGTQVDYSYTQTSEADANSILARLFENEDPDAAEPRFLLLDDGGKLIKAVHDHYPQFLHRVVALEQTEAGAREVEKLNLKIPVVVLGRAPEKKRLESPAIGESIAFHIDRSLEGLAHGFEVSPKEAAVIGFGPVGEATAEALKKRGYAVYVYDISDEAMTRAHAAGFRVGTREDVLGHGHLLVTATGNAALSPEDWNLLPDGAVLANGGSGREELGLGKEMLSESLRHDVPPTPFARAQAKDGTTTIDSQGMAHGVLKGQSVLLGDEKSNAILRHRLARSENGNQLLFLRGGTVVDLERGMPPEYAQFLLGLLYAAAAQVARASEPGVIHFDGQFVVDAATRALKRQRVTLENPDFTAFSPW